MDKKPYVVSGDIDILLKRWSLRKGFLAPQDRFFSMLQSELSNELGSIFDCAEVIPSSDLLGSEQILSAGNDVKTITLDRVYSNAPHRIELTRTVSADMSDRPITARQDSPDINKQIAALKNFFPEGTHIILYDDVIFTGELLEKVCGQLKDAGLIVDKIVCGVGIEAGLNNLAKLGINIVYVKKYKDVVDQVCERDFYPGVDYSGRTLDTDRRVGLPYLLPFGKPTKWASIPPNCAIDFSKFCIEQSIKLFQEIERYSNKPVLCSDIDRKLVCLPTNGASFVDYLKSSLSRIA